VAEPIDELLDSENQLKVEYKLTRRKRVPSRVRQKRKRYYRRNKSKIKRKQKRYRRKPRVKRLAKRRIKIRKRLHLKAGSRRRIHMSANLKANLIEKFDGNLDRLPENLSDLYRRSGIEVIAQKRIDDKRGAIVYKTSGISYFSPGGKARLAQKISYNVDAYENALQDHSELSNYHFRNKLEAMKYYNEVLQKLGSSEQEESMDMDEIRKLKEEFSEHGKADLIQGFTQAIELAESLEKNFGPLIEQRTIVSKPLNESRDILAEAKPIPEELFDLDPLSLLPDDNFQPGKMAFTDRLDATRLDEDFEDLLKGQVFNNKKPVKITESQKKLTEAVSTVRSDLTNLAVDAKKMLRYVELDSISVDEASDILGTMVEYLDTTLDKVCEDDSLIATIYIADEKLNEKVLLQLQSALKENAEKWGLIEAVYVDGGINLNCEKKVPSEAIDHTVNLLKSHGYKVNEVSDKEFISLRRFWDQGIRWEYHTQIADALQSDLEKNKPGFGKDLTQALMKKYQSQDWRQAYEEAYKFHQETANKYAEDLDTHAWLKIYDVLEDDTEVGPHGMLYWGGVKENDLVLGDEAKAYPQLTDKLAQKIIDGQASNNNDEANVNESTFTEEDEDDESLWTIYLDTPLSHEEKDIIQKDLDDHAHEWGEFEVSDTDGGINLHGISSPSGFKYVEHAIRDVADTIKAMGHKIKEIPSHPHIEKECMGEESLTETGEMSREELEPDGEWHQVRLDMEAAMEEAGVKGKVEPFDQYQGPVGVLDIKDPMGKGQYGEHAKIWLNSDDEEPGMFTLEYKGDFYPFDDGNELKDLLGRVQTPKHEDYPHGDDMRTPPEDNEDVTESKKKVTEAFEGQVIEKDGKYFVKCGKHDLMIRNQSQGPQIVGKQVSFDKDDNGEAVIMKHMSETEMSADTTVATGGVNMYRRMGDARSGPEEILFTPGDFKMAGSEDSILREKMTYANLKHLGIPIASQVGKEYAELVQLVLSGDKGAEDEMWAFHEKHEGNRTEDEKHNPNQEAMTEKKKGPEFKAKMDKLGKDSHLDFDGGDDDRLHGDTDIWVYANLLTQDEYRKMENDLNSFKIKGKGYFVYAWNDVSGYKYWKEQGETDEDPNYIQITASITGDPAEVDASQLASDVDKAKAHFDRYGNREEFYNKKADAKDEAMDLDAPIGNAAHSTETYRLAKNDMGESKLTEAEKLTPPKKWFKKMKKRVKSGNPSYDDKKVDATVGDIWYHKLSAAKKKQLSAESIEESVRLKTKTLPNGDLEISFANPKDAESLDADEDWAETFEDLVANNDFDWVSPEEIGALTDAPMFGEIDRNDQGDLTKVHAVYWFPDYMVKNPVEILKQDGKVVFKKAEDDATESKVFDEAEAALVEARKLLPEAKGILDKSPIHTGAVIDSAMHRYLHKTGNDLSQHSNVLWKEFDEFANDTVEKHPYLKKLLKTNAELVRDALHHEADDFLKKWVMKQEKKEAKKAPKKGKEKEVESVGVPTPVDLEPVKQSSGALNMSNENANDDEMKAEALGKAAFEAGKKSVPALDVELMKMVKGPIGSSIPLLKAWSKGWHEANLNGENSEETEECAAATAKDAYPSQQDHMLTRESKDQWGIPLFEAKEQPEKILFTSHDSWGLPVTEEANKCALVLKPGVNLSKEELQDLGKKLNVKVSMTRNKDGDIIKLDTNHSSIYDHARNMIGHDKVKDIHVGDEAEHTGKE
jgi:hypothetical protein